MKHIIYLNCVNPAMYTHFSFQQAIIKLCIRKQKDIPLQLQLTVIES